MQEAIDTIANTPMEGEAGKIFHYGNTGLQVVAAIIEKIGGKDFEILFQERIAKPLQMYSIYSKICAVHLQRFCNSFLK